MKPLRVLGIMSGTSIDSVDYALCRVSDRELRLLRHWQARYPRALQQRLHVIARGDATSWELAQAHHDLGRFFAAHAVAPTGGGRPELVGLHGQTVFHHPDRRAPATLQVGEPAYLVEALRVPVVGNFRAADLAAGGQGAPLATMFHQRVFARRGRHVCVNNLGGISNVTSLDWTRGPQPRVAAFDTGPANVLLDLAMRHFTRGRRALDRDGAWAARGVASEPLLACWLKHPFFAAKPPKSTGRELFGEAFFRRALPAMQRAGLSKFDVLATLTEFTARSLAWNYRLHLRAPPQTVVLSGGGAANPTLVRAIRRALREFAPAVEVQTSEAWGWPLPAVEPAAFALLASLHWRGEPGNLPANTGARRAALLGQVSAP
jgi:anhydro-N-acetylmuramic acid kinase